MFYVTLMLLTLSFNDDFITYPEAHKKFEKAKRPIAIIVTTDGCRHCVTMKNSLRELKKEYPEFTLCEIPLSDAKLQFEFIDAKRGVPQTFAYVYNNDTHKTERLGLIIGSVKKEDIYRSWGMK
jgi:glutaredoxin